MDGLTTAAVRDSLLPVHVHAPLPMENSGLVMGLGLDCPPLALVLGGFCTCEALGWLSAVPASKQLSESISLSPLINPIDALVMVD